MDVYAAQELRFKKQQTDLERVVMMSDQDPQMSRIAADFLWKSRVVETHTQFGLAYFDKWAH